MKKFHERYAEEHYQTISKSWQPGCLSTLKGYTLIIQNSR